MVLRAGLIIRWVLLATAIAGACFFSGVPGANASGFAVYTHGAGEMGMANSAVAHTEGPASNFFNPALLGEIEGNQIEAGTVVISPSRTYTSSLTGETVETESQLFSPSTLFGVYHVNDRVSAGIGINSPFGMGTEWPDNWEGRYIITNIEMQTFLVNPNLAVRITDNLTVAAGTDLLFADATIEKKLRLAPLPDGESKFTGDGTAWGFNVALLYKPADSLSFGMAYRSRIDLELEGSAEFTLPSATPAVVRASLPNTGGRAEFSLPAQMFAGLAWCIGDKFVVEAGTRWEQWSCYDKITFSFDQAVNGTTVRAEEKNWKNSMGYLLGIRYILNPKASISVGYLYDNDPVPDDRFDPQVTAAKKQAFSVGFQKRWGNITAAASYLYEAYEDRTKDNLIDGGSGVFANGEFEQHSHMGAISIGYQF